MIGLVLVTFVDYFVPLFSAVLLTRVILSYVLKPGSRILDLLTDLTEPILAPVRKVFPSTGGIDFAPLVTLLMLQGLQTVINNLVHG